MKDKSAISQEEIPFIPLPSLLWDKSVMADPKEILRSRLAELLAQKNVTPRALSIQIDANHSYVSQILAGRGGMPSATRLMKLAGALGTTTDYLTGESDGPDQVDSEVGLTDRPVTMPPLAGSRAQDGIPLVGTGDCADLSVIDTETGQAIAVERSSFDPDFTARYIARPPALRGARELYAIYFQGQSMEPRFEAGEVGIVDPLRPARIGDYVLVQINSGENDDVVSVLAKRLVRLSSAEVVLEQFNPAVTFKIERKRVARIHRIMPQTELLLG